MSVIVEETVKETLSKEEVLLLALNEVENQKIYRKAKLLFKKEIYSKEVVESFDEEAYVEVSPKTIKGYSLLSDNEGNLYLVKALNADAETDVYGFEVLSLPNVNDDELKLLVEYKKPVCVGKLILLGVFLVFIALGLYLFFTNLFDNLQDSEGNSQFSLALTLAYFYAGGYVTIAIGLLLLILKGCKKGCRK